MDIGIIVGLVFGCAFIFIGCHIYINRNWKKDKIKEWMSEPQTIAKITGTVNRSDDSNNYRGYSYRADILINGKWQKAESWDAFYGKKTCKIGEEVSVAYKPIKDTEINKIADTMMNVMVSTIMSEDWEEIKPRYQFKFLDTLKYSNEGRVNIPDAAISVGFGLLILLVSYLAWMGVI